MEEKGWRTKWGGDIYIGKLKRSVVCTEVYRKNKGRFQFLFVNTKGRSVSERKKTLSSGCKDRRHSGKTK